jgi:hypothetical protein
MRRTFIPVATIGSISPSIFPHRWNFTRGFFLADFAV